MWIKYYKKWHPILAQGIGASHAWSKMIKMTEDVEHNIWWQIKEGSVSFWFDNWTKLGALYFVDEEVQGEEEIKVKEFVKEGGWNREKPELYILADLVDHK